MIYMMDIKEHYQVNVNVNEQLTKELYYISN